VIKNTTLYHRFWYIKKRNAKRVNILLRLLLILIILGFTLFYANKNLMPALHIASECKVNTIVTAAVNSTVNETLMHNPGYEDLVHVDMDKDGRANSIRTDVVKLNKLSTGISTDVCNKLASLEKEDITVPFGALFGNSLLSGEGPGLKIKIQPAGNVETGFKSEFSSAGINQTRHRIYLQVIAKVSIIAPLGRRKTEITTTVPVAETIIIGKVPQIYLENPTSLEPKI
jgi:sporulation protein YunB